MEQPKSFRWFNPRYWSFATRLTWIMSLLILVTLAGTIFITVSIVRTELINQIGQGFQAQTQDLSSLVGAFLQEKVSQIQVLAISDLVRGSLVDHNASYTGDSKAQILEKIQALDAVWIAATDDDPLIVRIISHNEKVNPVGHTLAEFLANFPDHTEVFLTDRYGATVAATSRLSDYYQADEAWWQAAWNDGQGAVFISNPAFDESSGVTAILLAVPVYDHSGEVSGVLRSTLITDDLSAIMHESEIGRTGHAVLFDGSGEVLFEPRVEAGEDGSAGLAPDLRQAFVSQEPGFRIASDQSGNLLIFGHTLVHLYRAVEEGPGEPKPKGGDRHSTNQVAAAVDNLGWATVVRQETSEAFASLDRIVQYSVMVGLAAVGLASLVALFMARTITRPLIRLGAAAEQMGLGNLDTSLPPAGGDEVGRLTGSFRNMATQLRSLFDSLEQTVASRTRRLEIVATLGERLSAILNLEELLPEVVNQVKDNFGYYHAHIYLLDDKGEKLVAAEGTGSAGAEMKAKGHSIPLDASASLVARAARTGQIISVDNVRQAQDWLPNPLLPDTYAEMAVPILLEGRVVGVLDVQEDELAGLDQGDTSLLRALANQVGVAIRNARLFTEVETALNEAREIQRRYIAQSWDRTKVTRKSVGRVQISLGESTTLGEGMIASAQQQALSHQKPTVVALNGSQDDPATQHALVAPVMLRDVMIGDLQLHGIDPDREWTKGELALINGVIDQVAQIAENLRLFEETRERATREQTIREITDKLRTATSLEELVKITSRELGERLSAEHAVMELGLEPELNSTSASELAGNGQHKSKP